MKKTETGRKIKNSTVKKIMQKSGHSFLVAVLSGLLLWNLWGCSAKTPKGVVAKGSPLTLSPGNTITVTDCRVEGNQLFVTLWAVFSSYTFGDFAQVSVREAAVDQDAILCDRERTTEQNGFDVFRSAVPDLGTAERLGKSADDWQVCLVFTDDRFFEKTDPARFVLELFFREGPQELALG